MERKPTQSEGNASRRVGIDTRGTNRVCNHTAHSAPHGRGTSPRPPRPSPAHPPGRVEVAGGQGLVIVRVGVGESPLRHHGPARLGSALPGSAPEGAAAAARPCPRQGRARARGLVLGPAVRGAGSFGRSCGGQGLCPRFCVLYGALRCCAPLRGGFNGASRGRFAAGPMGFRDVLLVGLCALGSPYI